MSARPFFGSKRTSLTIISSIQMDLDGSGPWERLLTLSLLGAKSQPPLASPSSDSIVTPSSPTFSTLLPASWSMNLTTKPSTSSWFFLAIARAAKCCRAAHAKTNSGAINAHIVAHNRRRHLMCQPPSGSGTFRCTETHMHEKMVAKQLRMISQIVLYATVFGGEVKSLATGYAAIALI